MCKIIIFYVNSNIEMQGIGAITKATYRFL